MSTRTHHRPMPSRPFAFALGTLAIGGALIATSATALGGISGFNAFSGWNPVILDSANPPGLVNGDPNHIHWTGGDGNHRALWFGVPQDITEFEASFTYQTTGFVGNCCSTKGLAFVVHNAPAGLGAIGGSNSGLGYSGITKSRAVIIRLNNNGTTSTGTFANGNIGGGEVGTGEVNAVSGVPIEVTISYDGTFLQTTMVQGESVWTSQLQLVGSIANTVGGETAIVGITATTNSPVNQFISDFVFESGPAACPADVNDDGTVDGADLGILLGQWGTIGSADLNGSGMVDGADLGILLGDWGRCG